MTHRLLTNPTCILQKKDLSLMFCFKMLTPVDWRWGVVHLVMTRRLGFDFVIWSPSPIRGLRLFLQIFTPLTIPYKEPINYHYLQIHLKNVKYGILQLKIIRKHIAKPCKIGLIYTIKKVYKNPLISANNCIYQRNNFAWILNFHKNFILVTNNS